MNIMHLPGQKKVEAILGGVECKIRIQELLASENAMVG